MITSLAKQYSRTVFGDVRVLFLPIRKPLPLSDESTEPIIDERPPKSFILAKPACIWPGNRLIPLDRPLTKKQTLLQYIIKYNNPIAQTRHLASEHRTGHWKRYEKFHLRTTRWRQIRSVRSLTQVAIGRGGRDRSAAQGRRWRRRRHRGHRRMI